NPQARHIATVLLPTVSKGLQSPSQPARRFRRRRLARCPESRFDGTTVAESFREFHQIHVLKWGNLRSEGTQILRTRLRDKWHEQDGQRAHLFHFVASAIFHAHKEVEKLILGVDHQWNDQPPV